MKDEVDETGRDTAAMLRESSDRSPTKAVCWS